MSTPLLSSSARSRALVLTGAASLGWIYLAAAVGPFSDPLDLALAEGLCGRLPIFEALRRDLPLWLAMTFAMGAPCVLMAARCASGRFARGSLWHVADLAAVGAVAAVVNAGAPSLLGEGLRVGAAVILIVLTLALGLYRALCDGPRRRASISGSRAVVWLKEAPLMLAMALVECRSFDAMVAFTIAAWLVSAAELAILRSQPKPDRSPPR